MGFREFIRGNRVKGEIPDPVPLQVPDSCQRPPSLREEMQKYVRSEISKLARDNDLGSFEDEDDFDLNDGDDHFVTPYTVHDVVPDNEAPVESLDGSDGEPVAPDPPEAIPSPPLQNQISAQSPPSPETPPEPSGS